MKGLRLALLLLTLNFATNVIAADTNWELSPDGLGPIHIGMTLKEAEKATGKEVTNYKPEEESENEGCFYSKFKDKNLDEVFLMVSDNKIVRIDITSPTFKTTKGAHVGDTEAEVTSLYRNIQTQTHHYDPNGKYLTYKEGKNRAIRFETNELKQVTVIYGGRYQEVQYVEGCL